MQSGSEKPDCMYCCLFILSYQSTFKCIEYGAAPFVADAGQAIAHQHKVGRVDIDKAHLKLGGAATQVIRNQADGLDGHAVEIANREPQAVVFLARLGDCQSVQALPAAQQIDMPGIDMLL